MQTRKLGTGGNNANGEQNEGMQPRNMRNECNLGTGRLSARKRVNGS
jgi:hypothetical protein